MDGFVVVLLARFVCIFAREWAKIVVSLRQAVARDSPPDCPIGWFKSIITPIIKPIH